GRWSTSTCTATPAATSSASSATLHGCRFERSAEALGDSEAGQFDPSRNLWTTVIQAQRGTCLTDLPGFPATSGMTNQGCAQVPWRPFAGRLRPWPPAQGDGATSRCRRARLVLRDAFSRFLPFPAGLCSRDPVDRACGRADPALR